MAVIDWQVRDHAEQLKSIRHWRGNTDLKMLSLEDKVDRLNREMVNLTAAVEKSVKRQTQWMLLLAGSTATFATSVLVATGKI